MDVIKLDVLVIGGGLAGMMAALAAHSQGRKVAIVSKGPVGRSGNTLVSGAGISSATDEAGNDIETFLNDLLRSGKGLNNCRLTRKLAAESPLMLHKLEDYGVKLMRQNGSFKKRRPPGHSVPRNIPTDWTGLSYLNRGLSCMLPLLEKLTELNISVISGVSVFQLIKDGPKVIGAIGLDRNNKVYTFAADSVILATGGGGYLYAKTNNTRDITGDGLALALDAGCRLQDMEQIQFYPTMMFEPIKVPISNPLFGAGAILRNAGNERFMERYDPAADMATRDNMARAIFSEIQAGRGVNGCVYMDCTSIPPNQLKELYKDFYQCLLAAKLDPTRDYLKVSPCVHYFLGGVVIDEFAATSVPGLYAAGEICGGIHGANRLSGAALMEACVFGWQAGITAACRIDSACNSVDRLIREVKIDTVVEIDLSSELKTIRNMMWEHVSLMRSENGLQLMSKYIDEVESRVGTIGIDRQTIQLENMLSVAKTIVKSALARKESRGAHFRTDYPQTSPEFDKNIFCWKEGEELLTQLVSIGT
jgi:aspartate oxidase